MLAERPRLASHLSRTFFAPRRQVKHCPRCRGVLPSWSSVNFHKHSHANVALVPRVVRVVSPTVKAELVEEAVAWLDERWRGDVFVPDELLPLVAAV